MTFGTAVVISTYKGRHPVETVKLWSVAERQYVEVPRPAMLKEYDCHMWGVDLHVMLVTLYRTIIRVKTYYLSIVFHLLDMCVVNAWHFHRRHCSQRGITNCKTLIIFRVDIAQAVLRAGKTTMKSGRSPNESSKLQLVKKKKVRKTAKVVNDVRCGGVGHWPAHTAKKRRCKLCIQSYSMVKCVKIKSVLWRIT